METYRKLKINSLLAMVLIALLSSCDTANFEDSGTGNYVITFKSSAIQTDAHCGAQVQSFDLVAGKNIVVGSVLVHNTPDSLVIVYNTSGDWTLAKVAINIQSARPTARGVIGKYPYGGLKQVGTKYYRFSIGLNQIGASQEDDIFVQAYAEVVTADGSQSEGVFGGSIFHEKKGAWYGVIDYTISSPCIDLTGGLVAYYPYNANYNDISGNAYHGSPAGGSVNFTNDRFGNANSAIIGGNGYLRSSRDVFTFGYDQQFSVSIWFTLSNPFYSLNGRLLSNECPEGNFRIVQNRQVESFIVSYGDYFFMPTPPNSWTHLVYTYDNRSEKLYMNGLLVASNYDTVTETHNYNCSFTVGAKASSAYDRWQGLIDDVGVWSRPLSQEEVTALYTGPSLQ